VENLIQKLNLWNWRLTASSAVIGAGSLGLYWRNLPPEVPFLYSRPWGTQQLVNPVFLWALPVIALSVGVGVGVWGERLGGEGVLRAILLATSMVLQIILCVGLLRILLLVT
jgi:hypothetical protein